MSIYDERVNELVDIAAAIGANCEPCLKYHFDQASKLGVSNEDMLSAVRMAQKVKEVPAGKILALAERLLGQPSAIDNEIGDEGDEVVASATPVSPPAKTCCA